MKRMLLLALLLVCGGATVRAQIIQSATVTVERKQHELRRLRSGYAGFFEAGGSYDGINSRVNYEFSTTHGYRFASGLFLGAGVGLSTLKDVSYYDDENRLAALPLYGDVRWYFATRHVVRPFVGTRIGYNISLNEKPSYDDFRSLRGLYASLGGGLEAGRFTLSLNYLVQGEKYVYSHGDGNYGSSIIYDNHSLLLRLGVRF